MAMMLMRRIRNKDERMGFCHDMMLSESEPGLWGIIGALSAVYSLGTLYCL